MSSEIHINNYDFNENTTDILQKKKYGSQRPIVYIINNDEEAYIGETIDASIRVNQHRSNTKRRVLTTFNLITTDEFNKSVILDLESFLISHMSADNKYKLQNGNGGLQNHNYYNKEYYQHQFKKIWNKLQELKIVKQDIKKLENSNLFKYSPYKSLTDEQLSIVQKIKKQLIYDINNNKQSTFIINGGAGTGKTILGIYLMKLLSEIRENENELTEEIENIDENIYENIEDILKSNDTINKLKIGLVIPMKNLRKTLHDDVFNNISGLNQNQVLSPNDIVKENNIWDILIVDEAHRLRQRKNLPSASEYVNFDKNNKKLGFGPDGTELDWIIKKSKYQIFLYDKKQTIKPTDIDKNKFEALTQSNYTHQYNLNNQIRCLGGTEYINYINKIFSKKPPTEKEIFNIEYGYEFKLFNDVNDMVNKIKELNENFGLCRNLAGYARKWETKPQKPKPKNAEETNKRIKEGNFDIKIGNYKYIWNTIDAGWIPSDNSINEIGCIHTSQGFDLNYTGLIIGNDLKYNEEKGLYVDEKEYKDPNGKKSIKDYDTLFNYILNIYRTMCTRGIKGTYIYACDKGLKDYLSKFIDKA